MSLGRAVVPILRRDLLREGCSALAGLMLLYFTHKTSVEVILGRGIQKHPKIHGFRSHFDSNSCLD